MFIISWSLSLSPRLPIFRGGRRRSQLVPQARNINGNMEAGSIEILIDDQHPEPSPAWSFPASTRPAKRIGDPWSYTRCSSIPGLPYVSKSDHIHRTRRPFIPERQPPQPLKVHPACIHSFIYPSINQSVPAESSPGKQYYHLS